MNTRGPIPSGRRLRAMLSLAALCVISAASAQDLQAYDVELVIFQQLSGEATPENWAAEAASGERAVIPEDDPSPFESASEPPQAQPPAYFPALPASRRRLSGVEDTLRRNRNYRPIAHIGWTQPGYPRNNARFLPVNTFVSAATGLSGQIALSRGRYLHLTLDLTFSPPEEPGRQYVLRESRRMRSNERHYIDHPKFGVVAIITPVKKGLDTNGDQ